MAKQVSLQEVLSALGGPLGEHSLWGLLYQAHDALKKAIQDDVHIGEELGLLITPESILLGYGGTIQFLPGISHSTSNFSAPELHNVESHVDIEKCYIYSLGMSLLAAMQNDVKDPKASETQQSLLTSMTDENSNNRPKMEYILMKCSEFFESQSQARQEVDKLVSYVLGSTLEYYSDSGDDEADLEAEIQQAISMRGLESTENLYPPSYGSRASSYLSLGSSGGYPRSCSLNTPKVNSRESINMYSSLPMVFPASSQHHGVGAKQLSQNQSDDRLMTNSSLQERGSHQNMTSSEPRSNGSHLYTPSRRKKVAEKKLRAHDHKIALQYEVGLFRSSSDGQKRQVNLDNMPPLQLSKMVVSDSENYMDSNNECSPTPQNEEDTTMDSSCDFKLPKDQANSVNEEFDFVVRAEGDSGEGGEEGKGVPSPPPHLPMLESVSDICKPESTDENQTVSDEGVPDNKDEIVDNPLQTKSEYQSKGQIVSGNQSTSFQSRTSLKKLHKLFGPEFSTISGLQVEKSASTRQSIPADRRQVEVILLNGCTVQFIVELTSTCRELFNQVIAHQNLQETHIFGLAVIREHGELFLELDQKLMKYANKGWLSKKASSKFTVFFRVKYYVENINHLRFSETRHLYYLQLRKDILGAKTYCHEQSALKLAAFSLQAEKGDKIDYESNYCVEEFLPAKVIRKLGEQVVRSILPGMHSELKGVSREAAELHYLKEAQTLQEYGMVFYEVAKERRGKIGSVWLGLSVRGIVVYNVHKGIKTPDSHWPWKKIKNLSFMNRQFVVEVDDHRIFHFYTDTYKKAQYLLHLCINYHRFQLLPRGLPEVSSESTVCGNEKLITKFNDKDTTKDFMQLPEGNTSTVELVKGEDVLGLRLAGGRNKALGKGFVYVKSLNEGSIAARSGEIKEKDILLQVNGRSVYGMTHREAAGMILNSRLSVSLCIHRPNTMQWWEDSCHSKAVLSKDESWSDLTTAHTETTQLCSISEEN